MSTDAIIQSSQAQFDEEEDLTVLEEECEEEEAHEEEMVVEPEPVESPDYSHESNLSMYFRDMSGFGVLGPEDEIHIARRIEEETGALWAQLLSYPPVLGNILGLVGDMLNLQLSKFRNIKRTATLRRKRNVQGNRERHLAAAKELGREIAEEDFDDLALAEVLRFLGRLRKGEAVRELGALGFSSKSAVFRAYMDGVEAAAQRLQGTKHEFVKANLRLVVSIARRFNNGRMPLADLIQEGNIGLMKAVERFDYRRGFRFSTYASWWIRHAISRALADKGRAVRLPVHMIDTYQKISRTTRELQTRLGRKPSTEELAAQSGVSTAKIHKMHGYLLEQSVSLDRPVNDEDGRRFIDFVVDPSQSENTADCLIQQVVQTEALRVMDELTPIECDILRRRFGLNGEDEATLKEIGEVYNLSRERIRQLQEQALGKVRRALRRKDLM
ncbi:MAG: RNA polymerase sigma factor RpoD/SigA [Polyangia bacterium]|nr:RNA polymerase sigma factor RpoD/SigA [Polyangia bacterium]